MVILCYHVGMFKRILAAITNDPTAGDYSVSLQGVGKNDCYAVQALYAAFSVFENYLIKYNFTPLTDSDWNQSPHAYDSREEFDRLLEISMESEDLLEWWTSRKNLSIQTIFDDEVRFKDDQMMIRLMKIRHQLGELL